MPTYTCPECGEKQKRTNPVEPGKKLKCPECAAVFTVKGQKKAVEAAKPAAASAAGSASAPVPLKNRFDDEGPVKYELTEDKDSKDSQKERDKAYGPLRERFEKSKRGPALELVVKPSNVLLICGVLMCITAATTGVVAVWPMIFKSEIIEEKGKKSLYDIEAKKTKFAELTTDEFRNRLLWLFGGVGYFIWGAVVCGGASKMHEIEMYWLAMLGSCMAIIGPFVPVGLYLAMEAFSDPANAPDMGYMGPAILCFILGIPVCAWNVMTLLQEKVKAGFADETAIV